jgi:hypothetical protein
MAPASPPIAIAELRRWLERTETRGDKAGSTLGLDVPEVDARLPGNGLPLGHLHEVIEAGIAGEYRRCAGSHSFDHPAYSASDLTSWSARKETSSWFFVGLFGGAKRVREWIEWDDGAVYNPRAGVIRWHHDDTMMRNENQA